MASAPTTMTIRTRVVFHVIMFFSPFCITCGRIPVLEFATREDGRIVLVKVSYGPHDDPEKPTHIRLLMLAVFLMGMTAQGWLALLG